jgi:hypothetical protein
VPAAAKPVAAKEEIPFAGKLPANVLEMREAILAAVHSGLIEELRTPIDWNELRPDMGQESGVDLVEHLKRVSGDGEGREALAVLSNILSMPPARLPMGKDPENNAVFVWPYLAERPLDKLEPGEEVDLYRLMPPETAKAMREKKKWTWWRLSIGADGTWHAFRKSE